MTEATGNRRTSMRATDRQSVRLACLLDGSRMSREVHVRFCERPLVQSHRPTHPSRKISSLRNLKSRQDVSSYARLLVCPVGSASCSSSRIELTTPLLDRR